MEELVVRDNKLAFTALSYVTVLVIFLNLTIVAPSLPSHLAIVSVLIGSASSLTYFLINGIFIGHCFVGENSFLFRLVLGNLLLLALLGFVAWGAMLASSFLDATMTVAIMFISTTLASLVNRLKHNVGPLGIKRAH